MIRIHMNQSYALVQCPIASTGYFDAPIIIAIPCAVFTKTSNFLLACHRGRYPCMAVKITTSQIVLQSNYITVPNNPTTAVVSVLGFDNPKIIIIRPSKSSNLLLSR